MDYSLNQLIKGQLIYLLAFSGICYITACEPSEEKNIPNKTRDSVSSSDSETVSANTDSATETVGGCIEADTVTDSGNTAATDSPVSSDTLRDTSATTDSDVNSATDSVVVPDTADSDTAGSDLDTALCPPDMAPVIPDTESETEMPFCIDRYEASRPDATSDSHGSDGSMAQSVPGVLPWHVYPMSDDALSVFKSACEAAGKSLCTGSQWQFSCSGPDHTDYVFGNAEDFSVETCNTVATFCDDFCDEHNILADDCNTSTSNCGYHCGDASGNETCFKIVPTGQFNACTNMLGTFDINGNLWEIVTSEDAISGYEIRGGAFNCASPTTRLRCDAQATWTDLYAGFRCCKPVSGI
ncbi:MAG: SUMF1/EgtB/PvdO family nonheme iron enzyme [Deltaproteobacteria bacterium]|nr:SUMF1/EgtB/PvdO family nonheme iron enzyme [Deltaproteobacteria bacterium]